jgi:uncharacterized protein YukJ
MKPNIFLKQTLSTIKTNVVSIQISANLSLGGPTRSITNQIFVTHPTLGQHRTHIKKKNSFQIMYQKVTQVI